MVAKYKSRLDAAMGAALLLHGMVATITGFLSLAWIIWATSISRPGGTLDMPVMVGTAFLLPIVGLAFFFFRDVVIKRKMTRWHWCVYFGVAFFALFLSIGFWQSVMHDLALIFFDSHGRFGCRAYGAGYLVTSATMPSITFLTEPLFIAVCLVAQFFLTSRRGSENV